jgi:hypothetical protein
MHDPSVRPQTVGKLNRQDGIGLIEPNADLRAGQMVSDQLKLRPSLLGVGSSAGGCGRFTRFRTNRAGHSTKCVRHPVARCLALAVRKLRVVHRRPRVQAREQQSNRRERPMLCPTPDVR